MSDANIHDETAPKKTSGFRKGASAAWWLVRPNYKERWKEALDDGGLGKEIKAGYGDLFRQLSTRYRNADSFPESFDELMRVWGVTNEQIPQVVKGLRIEGWLFLLFSVLSLYYGFQKLFDPTGLYGGLFYGGILIIISVGLGFISTVRFWRASVLVHRIPIRYLEWLYSHGR